MTNSSPMSETDVALDMDEIVVEYDDGELTRQAVSLKANLRTTTRWIEDVQCCWHSSYTEISHESISNPNVSRPQISNPKGECERGSSRRPSSRRKLDYNVLHQSDT